MRLSEKQAQELMALLMSSLEKNIANYLCYDYEERVKMVNEIVNQQSRELVDLNDGVPE
jgi:hypothetical protein